MVSHDRRYRVRVVRHVGFALTMLASFAACSGGGGNAVAPIVGGGTPVTSTPTPTSASPTPVNASPTPTSASPTPKATATPSATSTPTTSPTSTPTPSTACQSGAQVATIGPAGGSITSSAASGTFTETAAANQFANATTVSLGYIAQSSLPAPLARGRSAIAGFRQPFFTAGAGNTYVLSFCTSFTGGTPSSGLALSASGLVPSSIVAGTQLNIAVLQGGTWVDVGSALVTSGGGIASTPPTVALPGITKSGSYLVYVPASGTNTVSINLGFAILADDGSGNTANGLQFVQLEDGSGNALPTPTTTYFPVMGTDLDGQSLTPDASRGAVIDGGNTVYFFSGIPQHTFMLSPTTVSVTAYGGDGDSIASLPNGDEVVVSADGSSPLAVISGILAGNPVIADTVSAGATNAARDGLVISNDGKALLSRGQSGIDLFKVTPAAAHAGSTGTGTTSYNFSLVTTFSSGAGGTVTTPFLEDGRDGMAFSPADSSRAVVIGAMVTSTSSTPTVQLLTGLTGSSPTVSSLGLRIPAVQRNINTIVRRPEPSAHREPFALTPSVGSTLYAVSITPDGTTAFVSTDAGIITVSGVNTGTLAQVGGAYAPKFAIPGGGMCQLSSASSIGVLPDGKYLIASVNCGETPGSTNSTQGSGAVLTIPIGAGGVLGAPVGQLNQTVTPFNDQILIH